MGSDGEELQRGKRLATIATGLGLPLVCFYAFLLIMIALRSQLMAFGLALGVTVLWRTGVHAGAWWARLAMGAIALADAITLIIRSKPIAPHVLAVLAAECAIAFILLRSRSVRVYLDAQRAQRAAQKSAQRRAEAQALPRRVSPAGTVLDDLEKLPAAAPQELDITLPDDWESAKPRLRMQLWHALRHVGAKTDLVTWIDVPRLWSAVVYDSPDAVIALNPEHLAKWGITKDEARKAAIANMIVMPLKDEEQTVESIRIRFLQAPYFAEGQALCLHARDLVGPAGTVFIVPSQSVMVAHPVSDMSSLMAPLLLKQLCGVIMRGQPNPVSPEVYWYNDGKFAVFEMKEVDGERGIELLPEFAEAIEALDRRRAPSELS